jgi:hypothetical protein
MVRTFLAANAKDAAQSAPFPSVSAKIKTLALDSCTAARLIPSLMIPLSPLIMIHPFSAHTGIHSSSGLSGEKWVLCRSTVQPNARRSLTAVLLWCVRSRKSTPGGSSGFEVFNVADSPFHLSHGDVVIIRNELNAVACLVATPDRGNRYASSIDNGPTRRNAWCYCHNFILPRWKELFRPKVLVPLYALQILI